jgi:hypothetical protein
MTISQNVASKLVVGFVAVSMLFTLSFAPAQAATSAELEAQIEALLAQIEALQGSTGGSSSCAASFTMDLTMGASGAEVTALQNFLIGAGHSIAAGATGYFGAQTQAALAAYQSANGISPAAGYFGPVTRAKVNASCSDDDANDDDANDDDDSGELSGEASLDTVEINDGEDTDVEEGQEDAPVAEIDVEFSDGDAKITRIDLALTATGSEEDPWDTFEDISLWVDGDEVARESIDDEDAYLDEDDGTIRLSGLDIVADEDEEMTIVVAVTMQNGVDDIPATWNVGVDAIRYVDGDDVTSTDTTTGDMPSAVTSDFDIDEEGGEDELVVRSSTNDPDSTTFELDEDDRSDWMNVFTFRLDTDDSENDIEINELPVALSFSKDTYANVVNDVKLVVDGEEFDDFTVASSSVAYLVFDIDGDLVIDAGEEAEVEVMVEFKALPTADEGMTMSATASSTQIDAEGADDLESGQLEGSATSETHTLRTNGVNIEDGEMDSELQSLSDSSSTDDRGVFTVEFDVTASGEDIFIAKSAAKSTSTSTFTTAGVYYYVTDGSGTEKDATSTTQSLSSTAETSGGQYVVREGETETFTLSVTIDPDITGYYAVNLFGINYNETTAGTADTQQRALPAEDFESPSENIPD